MTWCKLIQRIRLVKFYTFVSVHLETISKLPTLPVELELISSVDANMSFNLKEFPEASGNHSLANDTQTGINSVFLGDCFQDRVRPGDCSAQVHLMRQHVSQCCSVVHRSVFCASACL